MGLFSGISKIVSGVKNTIEKGIQEIKDSVRGRKSDPNSNEELQKEVTSKANENELQETEFEDSWDESGTSTSSSGGFQSIREKIRNRIAGKKTEIRNKIEGLKDKVADTFVDADGTIGDSKQLTTGDCYLLTTLNSLSYTENGQQIIKNAITDCGNGIYKVRFEGYGGTEVTVHADEILKAKFSLKNANGDSDVQLMEIAFEKLYTQFKQDGIFSNYKEYVPDDVWMNVNEDGNPIDQGGYMHEVIYALTGNNASYVKINDEEDFNKKINSLGEFQKNGTQLALYTSFKAVDKEGNVGSYNEEEGYTKSAKIKDVNGDTFDLITHHAWSIYSIDDDTVTIVNPWDSSKKYTVSKSEIAPYMDSYQLYLPSGDENAK